VKKSYKSVKKGEKTRGKAKGQSGKWDKENMKKMTLGEKKVVANGESRFWATRNNSIERRKKGDEKLGTPRRDSNRLGG